MRGRAVMWALPKEEIPITINIDRQKKFDYLQIQIPSGMKFVEFMNVAEFSQKENILIVNRIYQAAILEFQYFGIVVKTDHLPSKEFEHNFIKVDLINGDAKESIEIETRTFRPFLKVTEIPETFVLEKNTESIKVRKPGK